MFVNQVKEHLPSGNFDDMIMILKKFLSFMNLTVSSIVYEVFYKPQNFYVVVYKHLVSCSNFNSHLIQMKFYHKLSFE